MTYQVKPEGNKYIVVDEKGYIANGEEHSTKEKAERHLANIEAYCVRIGDRK